MSFSKPRIRLLFVGLLLVQSSDLLSSGFANPQSDFLLTIDESSVAVAREHACVLEQTLGDGIGGKAHCWGFDNYGRTNAPKDVSFLNYFSNNFLFLFPLFST